MIYYAGLVLLLLVLVGVFSAQNATMPVTVKYFFGRSDTSVITLICWTLLTGVVLGVAGTLGVQHARRPAREQKEAGAAPHPPAEGGEPPASP